MTRDLLIMQSSVYLLTAALVLNPQPLTKNGIIGQTKACEVYYEGSHQYDRSGVLGIFTQISFENNPYLLADKDYLKAYNETLNGLIHRETKTLKDCDKIFNVMKKELDND